MKKRILSALFLLVVCLTSGAFAQNVQVSAKMDSTNIVIGDQTVIHLDVTQDRGQVVYPPLFTDTIVKGVEILKIGFPDTTILSDDRINIKQDLLITSFDSALYYIPPFKYIAGEDTIYTNALALNVQTFEVDLESKELCDIKDIKKPPFVFMDYFWIVFIVLLVLTLIVFGILFYKRWKKRKDNPEFIPEELLIPAADAARKSLEVLNEKQLWQKGMEKEYYSGLTDILRIYIERRYTINAMEMTSAEIINSLKSLDIDKSVLLSLKDLMQTSDFVKFAKLRPGYAENESSIIIAESFVNNTEEKKVEENTAETENAEGQISEADSKQENLSEDKDSDSDHDKYMPKR